MSAEAETLRRDFEGALCFGIGGSHLGGETILEALYPLEMQNEFPISWVSNTDPQAIRDAVTLAKKKRLSAIILSKSGNTTETLSAFFHLSRFLDPKGYVAITDPSSGELRRLANENKWVSFEVPPAIGGRYSVLTAVGLFPAFLAGLDAKRLLEGAGGARTLLAADPKQNAALQFALLQYLWDQKHSASNHVLMPYGSRLTHFADWFVQLWGESLGKQSKDVRVGPTPIAALGTRDQHSLLQLLNDGPRNKVVGFLDIKEDGAKLPVGTPAFSVSKELAFLCKHSFNDLTHLASLATQKSLKGSEVPTYRIELKELNLETLGGLFFFFEYACALTAELYQINAFDQPGVEESKKLLREALRDLEPRV